MATMFDQLEMGPCAVSFKGSDLGLTQGGVEVTFATEIQSIVADQFGDPKVSTFIKSRSVKVSVPLAERDLSRFAELVPGSVLTGTTAKQLTVYMSTGNPLHALTGPLVIHPTSRAATDKSADITIPLAVSKGDMQISYTPDKQRVYTLQFEAYPDEETGALLTFGDASAVPDSTPDQYSIGSVAGAAPSSSQTSAQFTPIGYNAATSISITGGEYELNGNGIWLSGTSSISPDTAVRVRGTASAAYSTPVNVILTIGGVTATFTITTTAAPADVTPNQFTFPDVTNVSPGALQTSDYVTPDGYDAPTSISITGGEYQIEAGAWSTASGTLNPGQKVRVRHTATNSPSTPTNTTLTIGGVSDTFTSTTGAGSGYDVIGLIGDSISCGRFTRDAGDTDYTGSYQWVSSTATISSDTTPYEQLEATGGNNYLSPAETFARDYYLRTGRKCLIVPCGFGGSQITGGGIWAVGNNGHESAITRINAALAAAKAAFPDSRYVGTLQFLGTNDTTAGSTRTAMSTAVTAAINDFRARITSAAASWFMMVGQIPGRIAATNSTAFPIEFGLQDVHKSLTNVQYMPAPDGYDSGDHLHPNNAGNRVIGSGVNSVLADTAPCVISTSSTRTIFAGQKLYEVLSADKYASFTLSGAGASNFEVFEEYFNYGASAIGSKAYSPILRLTGDAAATAGTYSVTVNGKAANGLVTPMTYTLTVEPAYGTASSGPVTQEFVSTQSISTYYGSGSSTIPIKLPAQQFKKGLNLFYWYTNGNWTNTSGIRIAGVDAVLISAQTSGDTRQVWAVTLGQAGMYSPWIYGTGTLNGARLWNLCLTNTKATPISVNRSENSTAQSPPYSGPSTTCPAGGVLIGMGYAPSGNSLASPAAFLMPLDANGEWAGYRSSTGSFTLQGGSNNWFQVITLAFEKAP